MSRIELSIWEDPRESARVRGGGASRVTAAAVVLALHALAFIALASLSLNVERGAAQASTPMTASIIELPEPTEESWMPAPPTPPEISPSVIEIPEPVLGEIAVNASDGAAPTLTGVFIPPRPEAAASSEISRFERQASLPAGKMVRVILRVEVLPDGSTGVVAIDTASGFPAADTAAIDYARSIRWVPASYGGEPTAMKVRLPVVFTGTG